MFYTSLIVNPMLGSGSDTKKAFLTAKLIHLALLAATPISLLRLTEKSEVRMGEPADVWKHSR
jgi:hypothetical protein